MIFCVEDDKEILGLMLYALNAAGYEAEGFADGTGLWAALEQKKKEQADKLKELEKQIADAKKKKEDVMATKNLLDQRNQLLLEQIDDTQGQIQHAADEITRYEELEDLQYELFCEQVRS